MSASTSILRFTSYFERHGLRATLRRAALALRRTLFAGRMAIFYCDLAAHDFPAPDLPHSLTVETKTSADELSLHDLEQITGFWNPRLAQRNIQERFRLGASLWLIRSEDKLAAFSWTLRGRTITPYYFPLSKDDVQLFDFYVFPAFRGRAMLWFLIMEILSYFKTEHAARVFGDVAEWNQASLSFYKTVPFEPLGWVRKLTVLGHTVVCWPACADKCSPVRAAAATSEATPNP